MKIKYKILCVNRYHCAVFYPFCGQISSKMINLHASLEYSRIKSSKSSTGSYLLLMFDTPN